MLFEENENNFIWFSIKISELHGNAEIRTIQAKQIKDNSSVSGMSNKETLSLIQTALQPEIEKRLEARRNMDRIAMETLLKLSHSPSSTNQVSVDKKNNTLGQKSNHEDTNKDSKL